MGRRRAAKRNGSASLPIHPSLALIAAAVGLVCQRETVVVRA